MITTRFLTYSEYTEYGEWMKSQDADSRQLYFGMGISDDGIDLLVEGFIKNKHDHYFLVAEDRGVWVGTIHIAVQNVDEVEFGVMVATGRRKQGIADTMLQEAILWARNRGFHSLYMHCLGYNSAIKHLCIKHGLSVKTECGESDVNVALPPATPLTISQEIVNTTCNIYTMMLQRNIRTFQELYG
jgi:RimJ/RimL family protein N-acetyltransferase